MKEKQEQKRKWYFTVLLFPALLAGLLLFAVGCEPDPEWDEPIDPGQQDWEEPALPEQDDPADDPLLDLE